MTMQDVEERLPFPADRLLKTLVFRVKGSGWGFAVVRGRNRVDYRKLASALGVSREAIEVPSVDELARELGVEIGGICPISTRPDVRTVFDDGIGEMDVVFCGVGRNDRSLEIELAELLRVTGGQVVRIVRDQAASASKPETTR
jgi:Cys-tRNA(Pro)/Cys-tRNA(Cys) deacylase